MTNNAFQDDLNNFKRDYNPLSATIGSLQLENSAPNNVNKDIAQKLVNLSHHAERLAQSWGTPKTRTDDLHDAELSAIKRAGKPVYLIFLIWLIFQYSNIQLVDYKDHETQITLWGIGFTGLTQEKLTRFFGLVALFYSGRLLVFHIRRGILCPELLIPGRFHGIRVIANNLYNLHTAFASYISRNATLDKLDNLSHRWLIYRWLQRPLAFLLMLGDRGIHNITALRNELGDELQSAFSTGAKTNRGILWRFSIVDLLEGLFSVLVPFGIALMAAFIAFAFTSTWVFT